VIPLEEELLKIIKRRIEARRLDCPLIFHRVSQEGKNSHRPVPGQPIRLFDVQWRSALKAAGLPPGLIPYDLRRTALRNMIRAGTDTNVAMAISGHRTRSTFDRYNITDEEDIRVALRRNSRYVKGLPATRKVTKR
jgi:integrase